MAEQPHQDLGASDAELVAAARSGDIEAFEKLYFRHKLFVFRVARRYTQNDDEALDTTQDVFVYLLAKLPKLTLRGKLSTYLYPITKNIALTRARNAARRRTLTEKAPHRTEPSEPPDQELANALARLTDEHREVLLMRIVDEMTTEEVAAALAIPLGTVKSRLHHAITNLRADQQLRSDPAPD